METKVMNQKDGKSKNNKKWQKVMIAGIPAIALGGAVGVYASTLGDDENISENADDTAAAQSGTTYPDVELAPLGDIPAASDVNNDMSFEEAFAAAREEVGPGGVFEWHGGVYGTYTQDEWAALSDEQRAQFSSEGIGIPYKPEEETAEVEAVEIEEVETVENEDEVVAQEVNPEDEDKPEEVVTVDPEEPTNVTAQNTIVAVDPVDPEEPTEEDIEIQVTGDRCCNENPEITLIPEEEDNIVSSGMAQFEDPGLNPEYGVDAPDMAALDTFEDSDINPISDDCMAGL